MLQGRILGDQIIEDGSATVGILALQDAYGTGLAKNVEKSITGANGEVVETVIYDPKAAEFTAEVSKIKGADPEAIVVIGFDESAKIIQELAKQGVGPQDGKKLYLVDGNTGNALGEKLPKGLLKGVKGTVPGAAAGAEFQARLKSVDPALKDFSYSAESYDAVTTIALGAVAAKSDAGTDIAKQLVEGHERRHQVHDVRRVQQARDSRHRLRLRRRLRPDRVRRERRPDRGQRRRLRVRRQQQDPGHGAELQERQALAVPARPRRARPLPRSGPAGVPGGRAAGPRKIPGTGIRVILRERRCPGRGVRTPSAEEVCRPRDGGVYAPTRLLSGTGAVS